MTPRPRSFDENTVLARAKDIFWRKGYEATSMQDLVDHMQIGRQSLYNTFGDKHTLYMRALGHYLEHDHKPALGRLGEPGASLADVERFFDNQLGRMVGYEDRRSCFVVNAIQELSPRDSEVNVVGIRYREELQQVFTAALHTAKERGEASAEVDAPAAARVLTQLVLGMSVMWKSNATAEDLRTTRDATLAPLRGTCST